MTNTVQAPTLSAVQPAVTSNPTLPLGIALQPPPAVTLIALAEKPMVISGNGKGADISVAGDKNGQEIKVGDRTVSVSTKGIVIDLEDGKQMVVKRTEDGRIAAVTFDAQQKAIGFKLQDGTTAIQIPTGNGKSASLNVDVKNGELLSFSVDTGGAEISAKRNAESSAFEYASGKGPQVAGKVIKNELELDGNKNLKLTSSMNNNSPSLTPSAIANAAFGGLVDLAAGFGGAGSGVLSMVSALASKENIFASIRQSGSGPFA